MDEARITEFFGETQTDGRSARKQEEVLDFMGLGSCLPREAWRLPSPQPLQYLPEKLQNVLPQEPKSQRKAAAGGDKSLGVDKAC